MATQQFVSDVDGTTGFASMEEAEAYDAVESKVNRWKASRKERGLPVTLARTEAVRDYIRQELDDSAPPVRSVG